MGKPSIDSESSINHFSHPHPLQILNHQSLQALTHVSCSGCHLEASDQSVYGCLACNYFLHKKCSEMPQKITHPFDQHCFSLLPKPKYSEGVFNCDGCGKQGGGFCYHCETCGKDLHILCASLPMLLTHQAHHHQLSLTFSPPYHDKSFYCDICKKAGSNYWLYRCNTCEFDVHLSCVTTISSAARTRSTLPTPSPPMQNPMSYNSMNNPNPVVHGSVPPNGIGQAQAQVIGMPFTARPQMMNTMPPNTFVNSANPAAYGSVTTNAQQAFAQQHALAMQQAFAQQQVFAQQHALSQQQALAQQQQAIVQQRQAIMQQQALGQQPGNMLMNSFIQGLAGGVAQGATESLIQGLVGGNGGNGGGGVSFLGFGGSDGSVYDGSFGGMDGGGGGGGGGDGDGSY